MRFKLTTPEQIVTEKTDWKLKSIHLDEGREVLQVVVTEGYEDGAGQFIPLNNTEVSIYGAEYQAFMTSAPAIRNFKRLVFQRLLQAKAKQGDEVP